MNFDSLWFCFGETFSLSVADCLFVRCVASWGSDRVTFYFFTIFLSNLSKMLETKTLSFHVYNKLYIRLSLKIYNTCIWMNHVLSIHKEMHNALLVSQNYYRKLKQHKIWCKTMYALSGVFFSLWSVITIKMMCHITSDNQLWWFFGDCPLLINTLFKIVKKINDD